MLDARKYMHFHVRQTCRYSAIGVQHGGRSHMILVPPDTAHWLWRVFELLDEVKHLCPVAGNASGVAQTLGAEDRVGAAVTKADHRSATVAERLRAQDGPHIGK